MSLHTPLDHMNAALDFMHPKMGDPDYGVIELMAPGCTGAGRTPQGEIIWRGQSPKGIAAGWYNDRPKLVSKALSLSGGWGNRFGESTFPRAVYITMNPVDRALLSLANNCMSTIDGRTKGTDVKHYRNIFFDVDAECRTGASSTAEEHAAAIKLAKYMANWFKETLYWPDPMIVDSGNGAHITYKVHFDNTKENVALLKELQAAVKAFFDKKTDPTLAKLDSGIFNPDRLIKLPGTITRKGMHTEERPHRPAKVLSVPSREEVKKGPVITSPMIVRAIEYLNSLLEVVPPMEAPSRNQPNSSHSVSPHSVRPPVGEMFNSIDGIEPTRIGGSLRVDEYLRDNGIKVIKVKEHEDSLLYCMEKCLFDDSHTEGQAAIGQSSDGKLFYKCFHNSCSGVPDRQWKQARALISGTVGLGRWMEGGSFGVAFPELNPETGRPYPRVSNFKALLEAYDMKLRKNMMSRKIEFRLRNGLWEDDDDLTELARDFIEEVAGKHGFPVKRLEGFIRLLGAEKKYHPVKDWVNSKPWDGVLRMKLLADTVTVPADQREQWQVYLEKWLVSAIAALYVKKFESRGVLVFQGDQNIGKTTWLKNLVAGVPAAFGKGQHLDPSSKDSLMTVLMRWIVELGELDSTFRKADISRLKAFIDKYEDEIRVPYGRAVVTWIRRTVFAGTVNDPTFLLDPTGNARWWVIKVLKFDWHHKIDMQQVWAEAKFMYDSGSSWYLTPEESEVQDRINSEHVVVDPIEENLHKYFRFDTPQFSWNNYMTATDILEYIGISNPSRPQSTTAGTLLRKLCGGSISTTIGSRRGRFHKMPPKRDMYGGDDDDAKTSGPGKVIPFEDITKKEEK